MEPSHNLRCYDMIGMSCRALKDGAMMKNLLAKLAVRSERGQSLVEMTIGFVILLMLASGVLDLGRAYFTFIALEDGAGEAALYTSINPGCEKPLTPPDTTCDDPNNADFRARHSGGALVDWTDVTQTTIDIHSLDDPLNVDGPYALGETIEVIISYNFEVLTPFIGQIAGDSLTLTAHATQSIVGES